MPHRIDFKSSLGKVSHAIAFVLAQTGPLTRVELDWLFYVADRDHLDRFNRPVLGLRFRDRNGLPESGELDELVTADSGKGPSWRYSGGTFSSPPSPWIDAEWFSRSDMAMLGDAGARLIADRDGETMRAALREGWNATDGRPWFCGSNMLPVHRKTPDSIEELAYLASVVRY